MDRERTLQVVLGEAEPDEGFLRFVLEGEGFDIVGMASTDDELERVLRGARPDVIVLDAGISATAAVEAKEQANGAALVVIWPGDVVAAIADEHVEPHLVVDDLGPAVRSASLRARPREERLVIPDTIDEVIDRWREAERELASAAPAEEAKPEAPRLDRSARGVLVAAMTWILVLTTLATIAVGVPGALDVFAGRSPGRPTSSLGPTHSPSPSTETPTDTEPARTTSIGGCDSGCSAIEQKSTKKQGADHRRIGGSAEETGNASDGGPGSSDGSGGTGSGGDEQGGSGDQGNQDQGNQDQGNDQQGDGEQGNQDQGNQDQGADQQGDGGSQQQDDQGLPSSDVNTTEDDQGAGSDVGSSNAVVSIA